MTNKLRWSLLIWVLTSAVSLPVAAQGWKIPQPSPGLMPNPVQGKALYAQHCASCHGADLKGSNQGPPMLHRIYEPSHHADMAITVTITVKGKVHQKQRRKSLSSGLSSASSSGVTGSSVMPHFGQLPGPIWRISGCIGQVYSVPVVAGSLGAGAGLR